MFWVAVEEVVPVVHLKAAHQRPGEGRPRPPLALRAHGMRRNDAIQAMGDVWVKTVSSYRGKINHVRKWQNQESVVADLRSNRLNGAEACPRG